MPRAKYHDLREAVRHLKVGDIIMVRAKRTLPGFFITRLTESYWSHAAIVFNVPEDNMDGMDVLVAEAQFSRIEIHRLGSYLLDTQDWELGIKRLPILTERERDRFLGFFLDSVDVPYDKLRIALMALQTLALQAFKFKLTFESFKGLVDRKSYICTTYIQRAYYLAVDPEKRERTLFRGSEKGIDFLQMMEHISPKQIAESKNTIWLCNPHV